MNKNELTPIIDAIAEREEFKATLNMRKEDELFIHSYNCLEIFDTVVILSTYSDTMTDDRQFLIWNATSQKLREIPVSGLEDDILRFADDELPFLEYDKIQFLICRNQDNTISRGDK